MNKNTLAIWAAFALVGIGLTSCGKKIDSSSNPLALKGQQDTASATTPVLQPVLALWQQGDKSAAVGRFLATDWSARPLFPSNSAWSLSEDQFRSLSEADGRAKASELTTQVGELKQMAAAVAQAGRDAAAKQDSAQAIKAFTSLKECGEALDRPNSSKNVELTGRWLKKLAEGELAKLKQ